MLFTCGVYVARVARPHSKVVGIAGSLQPNTYPPAVQPKRHIALCAMGLAIIAVEHRGVWSG